MRQYRSRLMEVEEQKSMKSALIFGGLTVLIIILILIFGISLFSKFISIFNRPSNQIQTTQAATVLAPTLSFLPQYTNQKSIVVKGTATANLVVKIFFNNSLDEAQVDNNGNFAMNVGLSKGANVIYAKAMDKLGNLSVASASYTVNYIDQIPNLTVTAPQNNQNFYGPNQQTLNIQGSTDINNSVTVNGHVAIVDGSGKFSFSMDLQNGDNQLKIISVDQAGNKKEIDLKVTFNP